MNEVGIDMYYWFILAIILTHGMTSSHAMSFPFGIIASAIQSLKL